MPAETSNRGSRQRRLLPARERGHRMPVASPKSDVLLTAADSSGSVPIGGGFMKDIFSPADGDHEIWLEFLQVNAAGDKRVNDTQTLNVLVLDIYGRSVTVGYELTADDGSVTRGGLRKFETLTVKPGMVFRLFNTKDSESVLCCVADHGYRTFMTIKDSGSDTRNVTSGRGPGYAAMSQEKRLEIGGRRAALRAIAESDAAVKAAKTDASRLDRLSSGVTVGANPKPIDLSNIAED